MLIAVATFPEMARRNTTTKVALRLDSNRTVAQANSLVGPKDSHRVMLLQISFARTRTALVLVMIQQSRPQPLLRE